MVSEFLPFVVVGIATGAAYGLAAVGLILTYKTSGIFNFAHGATAAIAAYLFYFLHTEQGIGWIPALLVSVLVVGPVIGLVFERIAAHLAERPVALKIAATVGIVLVVQGLATIKFGPNTIIPEQFLPGAGDSFSLAGAVVTYDRVIVAAVAVLAVAGFYLMFRATRTGVAMRAVVDDPDLLAMLATPPARVRRLAWVTGSTFAALSGVLLAPLIGLDSILLTYLVVQAFGAAAIGAFSSIPLTFAGGLAIGIASAVSTKYVTSVPSLAGVPASLPFIVLLTALLVIPKRKLLPPSQHEKKAPPPYQAPDRVRLVAAGLVLLPLLLVPQFVGANLAFYTVALITAIMLLSLGLLVRTSGQVSLCHATFAAVGAVAFSQFNVDVGVPWLLAILLAGLVTMAVGALVAIPAIRLSGLFLALATFGFGILVEALLFPQSWMFTSFSSGRVMPMPSFASTPEDFYYLVLAGLVLTAIAVVTIERSRLGRLLQGMSGSNTAVTAMGLSTYLTKVIVFCISAFIAGVAGALLGVQRGYAVPGDAFFISFNSLVLLAMLVMAPFAVPWYALVALAGVLPAYLSGGDTAVWLNVFFGLSAVIVSLQGGPPPMPAKLRKAIDRLGGRRSSAPMAAPEARAPTVEASERAGLTVSAVSVRFGGLVAVDKVSFAAPMGEITGLIGPNGAGKTTLFDACSGLNRRYTGRIELHGQDISRLAPASRARLGLGRTFQRVQLCDQLTVLENVMLGREAGAAGAKVGPHLLARPAERQEAEAAAWAALETCRIPERAVLKQAGTLSIGQARLVELARLLAGPFDMLLLDEPSSGLDPAETARFGELLEEVVAQRRVGILLVEHDVGLIMRVCSAIHVLDFGKLILTGTPAEIAASEAVQAAYLGGDPTAATPAPAAAKVRGAEA